MTDKQRRSALSNVLMSPNSVGYNELLVYIVYKTLLANGKLTLNQLRHLLMGELLIGTQMVDTIVGVMAAKYTYNCLSMYQIKQKPDTPPNFYIELKESTVFSAWLAQLEHEHPEFLSFEPPLYERKVRS